jgi:AraC-like DNA-binding protein
MNIIGVGQINLWEGGSLWIGLAKAPTDVHAHHAIQIGLALKGKLRFKEGRAGAWREYDAAVIPSQLPHAFEATGSVAAQIFCEPESSIGRKLAQRFGRDHVTAIPDSEATQCRHELAAIYASGEPDAVLDATARGVAAKLAEIVDGARETDTRILRAVDAITSRLDRPVALAEIARDVHLSPGRFRHLFVEEMGIPFRRYLLWRRLQRALEVAVRGGSWAEAAHAASFADSAHLTRTFRRMFGIAPSALDPQQPAAGRDSLRGAV